MKKLVILVPFVLLLSACGATNGWDALPVDNPAGCFQITEWHQDGSGHTVTSALGVFCPVEKPAG